MLGAEDHRATFVRGVGFKQGRLNLGPISMILDGGQAIQGDFGIT